MEEEEGDDRMSGEGLEEGREGRAGGDCNFRVILV